MLDAEVVQDELEILRNLTGESNAITNSIFEKCEEIKFKKKYIILLATKICQLAITSPVSVATNKRTFSKLKLIMNHLQSISSDNRLDSLMLLSIEKDVDKYDLDKIINYWASLKNRRIQF